MVLLASLAQLSFGSVFERYLPVAGIRTRSFVFKAYVMCLTAALLLASTYVLVGLSRRFLPGSVVWRFLFIIAVVLWTIFALQDSVLIGLRATRWVPVENIIYSAMKLALIPVFLLFTKEYGIFLAWVAPLIIVNSTVTWYLFSHRIPLQHASSGAGDRLPSIGRLLALSGAQYATLLISVITSSIGTLIVIQRLGPVANAHYYLPSQISGGVALFLWSIVRSFLVEASAEPWALRRHSYVTLRALVVIVTPVVVFGVILAPEILRIFGPSYVTNSTTLLRLLLLALPGMAISAFYSSFAWIDQRVWWMSIRDVILAAIYFTTLLSLIGRVGILAMGYAALTTSVMQAIFFLPILVRRYRSTTDSPGPVEDAGSIG